MHHHTQRHSMAEDTRTFRYWHPESQRYAGGDHLATALLLNWHIHDEVVEEQHPIRDGRSVTVYYFTLSRDDTTFTLPVIGNPYVIRLIQQLSLHVAGQSLRPAIHSRYLSQKLVN